MDELLDLTFDWFEAHGPLRVRLGVCTMKSLENKATFAFGGSYLGRAE